MMSRIFQYDNISGNRSELMGLAIIWVFFYHSGLTFSGAFQFINYIRYYGVAGVDVFLLVSGLGLFFSLRKNDNPYTFYRKRLLRILPTYWVVVAFFSVIWLANGEFSIKTFVLQIFTLGYWIDNYQYWWYISAILVLYASYPVFYKLFNKYNKAWVLAGITLVSFGLGILAAYLNHQYLLRFILRIPIFFLGGWYGWVIFDKVEVNKSKVALFHIAFLAIGLVGAFLMYYFFDFDGRDTRGLNFYCLFFLVPVFVLVLAYGIRLLPDSGVIRKTLRFIGVLSLEVYLVHENLIFLLSPIVSEKLSVNKYIEYAVYLLLSILLAWGINKVIVRTEIYIKRGVAKKGNQ